MHKCNGTVVTAAYTSGKEEGLKCWQISNVMAALLNIGGALCSTPQSLADGHYNSAVQ